ncbi:hypothetical protein DKX38_002873 [Salix brachista]|uniref:NAD-dependent epimerase/dehydratase domain-containing protein n=1 Tax=Salix brachista TaxID=2182728 RepID=A0A5N5NN93_9ROSI|nr:hypothetical protein DKX38_002873 [Salix brachista]
MEGKGMVCVTGGTGFVASWLIMRLLEQGYTVRTTVRSKPTEGKRGIGYLTDLPGARERLQIFHADLDRPDSFNEAIEGCTGVFHVAHPTGFTKKEPEEMVIKRATEGTIGILQACLNSKTAKRVVYLHPFHPLKGIQGFKIGSLSSKKLLECEFKFNYGLGDMFDGAIQSYKEKDFF